MRFRYLFLAFFLTFGQIAAPCRAAMAGPGTDFDKNRAKLLSYIIAKQLRRLHYSQKPLDDALSRTAFDLYMKQVDPRKRFFLKQDVDALRAYESKLDDEMKSGLITFPVIAEEVLRERVALVRGFVNDIMAGDLDLEKRETLEVDNDKLDFCATEKELRERWRKTLKYQVVSQYLDLIDIEKAHAAEEDDGGEKRPVKSDADLRAEAAQKVKKSTDGLLHRMERREAKDIYNRFFLVITKAYDPHSNYMPPTQKEDFDIHMRGSLEGIGAVLQEEDGYIKVLRVIPGGAAYRQKQLEAEDIIMMVAQGKGEPVDISDMRIRDAVALIRGKKGTEVRLTVKKPDGKIMVIPIIRDVVQLEETFVKSAVVRDGGQAYGYIKIPSFYRDFQAARNGGGRNVTDDVKAALERLRRSGIRGLLVDLRNNGGGALVDAVNIAGLFFGNGPVVQIKTIENAEVLYDNDPKVYYDGPMVVLVNRLSASASEIFAGAMQDYRRALIVGSEHSYGKGTVQTLINLDNNLPFFSLNMAKYKPLGALKLTTQKFYRVNGESTQHRGVVPDIVLPDRFKYSELGEQYVENSLPWDKIDPVPHAAWRSFPFDIEKLRRESAERVAADKKFQEIVAEAEEARQRMEHTLVDIDLASVRAEREKLKKFAENADIDSHAGAAGDDLPDHELTPEEEEKQLVEKVENDPYVTESLRLLRVAAP